MKKRIYAASCVALLVILLLELVGYRGAQEAQRMAEAIQGHLIPELRALEQMRFGTLRIVSSTSEMIVVSLPGRGSGVRSGKQLGEIALVNRGDAEFQRAYLLLAGPGSHPSPTLRQRLQEIADNHARLLAQSASIVQLLDSTAPLGRVKEAKEAFEDLENQNLDLIGAQLDAVQAQADRQLATLGAGLAAQKNTLELLGLLAMAVLMSYLAYVSRLMRRESAARDLAEQLARDKAREVEERREIEGRLVAHQKLESLGTLVGGLAHTVNNFLVPVVTLSKLHVHDAPEDSGLREDLARILSSGEKASAVLREVMAFARTGTRNTTGSCDLAEAVHRCVSLSRSALPPGITLTPAVTVAKAIVTAREADIDAMLLNLVRNAIDAISPGKGRISIDLDEAVNTDGHIAGMPVQLPAGTYAHLRVTDDGCGIPGELARNIFDPFFTTKAVGKGAGLGLSITYGTVSAAGGEITVASEPGSGARFDVFLPMQAGREDPR